MISWYFVDTGLCGGEFNMKFDEQLAHTLPAETGVVRVYGWSPHAISLGWNQGFEEIDEQSCREDGLDVVRRPTGGRAILHSDELTYCVVMPAEGTGVLPTYHEISRALLAALVRFGVGATFQKTQPHFPSLYQSASSAVCFTSSARYEVQYEGKKLIGSAQRRFVNEAGHEVVLQHGSILLGPSHRNIVRYLRIREEGQRDEITRELETRTTDFTDILGQRPSRARLVECLLKGFEEAWNIRFHLSQPEEWMMMEHFG